jgi:hypothetical protein
VQFILFLIKKTSLCIFNKQKHFSLLSIKIYAEAVPAFRGSGYKLIYHKALTSYLLHVTILNGSFNERFYALIRVLSNGSGE